jgi:hypothetical protein
MREPPRAVKAEDNRPESGLNRGAISGSLRRPLDGAGCSPPPGVNEGFSHAVAA